MQITISAEEFYKLSPWTRQEILWVIKKNREVKRKTPAHEKAQRTDAAHEMPWVVPSA